MPTVIWSGASSVAPTKESTMIAEGQNTHGSRTRSRASAAVVISNSAARAVTSAIGCAMAVSGG